MINGNVEHASKPLESVMRPIIQVIPLSGGYFPCETPLLSNIGKDAHESEPGLGVRPSQRYSVGETSP